MDSVRRSAIRDPGEEARQPGLAARPGRWPVPAVLVCVALFLGAGLGLATMGGWTGIAAVLCLGALMVAFVAAASR